MDDSLPLEFWQNDLLWLHAPIPIPVPDSDPDPNLNPARQISAFVPYLSRPVIESTATAATSSNSRSVPKKVIEYWRKQWHETKDQPAGRVGDLDREKCHRHMLNERVRREKQRHSYFALHSMLSKKTKNDKNSIIQMAGRSIQELKVSEEMLKRRNSELEMEIARKKKEKQNGRTTTPIRVSLANPSSGINSMLAVLKVLNTVGVNANAIHATFFDSHFSAQLSIDTHMRAAEVERALQVTLTEAERKFQRKCQEGSKNVKESNFNFNNNNNLRGPQGGSRLQNLKFN